MRANEESYYSRREFAPPKTTNPEETRQQWNQRQTEARALEAQMRAEERRELAEGICKK